MESGFSKLAGTYKHIHGMLTCILVQSDHKPLFEEKAESQKDKDVRRKKQRSNQDCEQLVDKLCESHTTPTAATAIARDFQEWFQFMLGVSQTSKNTEADLPHPPT